MKRINSNCEACGNNYSVQVQQEGQTFTDFGIICCVFCGHQIKLYQRRWFKNVERTDMEKAVKNTKTL